jgi:hypothetical protein
MLTHAEAVAADVDDMIVMKVPVDQCGVDDFISQDPAPIMETLVASGHMEACS